MLLLNTVYVYNAKGKVLSLKSKIENSPEKKDNDEI